MIYDASVVEAYQNFGNKFYFAKLQLQWILLGILLMSLVTKINYHFWQKNASKLLLVSIILLFLVLLPFLSQEIMGARRWLKIGNFTLQPGELTKIAFVAFLASWLSQKKPLKPLLLISGLILALLMFQPDFGSSIVIFGSALLVYFSTGASLFHFIAGSLLSAGGALLLIITSDYRKRRLLSFLNPGADPQGASYHLRQILIALGSGGFWGLGIGKSRQKYEYLPMATTDSIFAVIAEEVGFFGSLLIILLFLFLIYRCLKIAQRAPDAFGQLLGIGITSWLALQFFINLAAIVALCPFTGIPLPFVSYGGSSVIINLLGIGILLNLSRHLREAK